MSSQPQPGRLIEVAPGIRRLTAPNPSPMTGPGTNSYIVGHGPYAVIDPAVEDATHLELLLDACDGQLGAILLTHRHPDHTGGAIELARQTAAPIRAWAKSELGEYDTQVPVDTPIVDGERLSFGGLHLQAIHSPGHAADHLCFVAEDGGVLFAGDSIMADVTVVILPPDGAMHDYMATLERLAALPVRRIAPGHGRMLDDPAATIAAIIAHRRQREAQVLAATPLDAPVSAQTIAAELYPDLDSRLQPMAAAQVAAHLIGLASDGEVVADGDGWRLPGLATPRA